MLAELTEIAARTDAAVASARRELVAAVRRAANSGMTQAQIATAIRRSQPEVSRLLRFHGTSQLARQVRRAAPQIRELVREAGGVDVRVFGSVATGQDRPDSDVDLLFEMRKPLGLMALTRLETQIARAVGANVDLVPTSALRPDLRERILAEAVPL